MPDITNAKACYMLKEIEDVLFRKIRSLTDATEIEYQQAILNRLRFLRLMLQALVAMWPDKKISPNETEMGEIQKLLSGSLDVMPVIRKTICKGTQAEPNCKILIFLRGFY